MEKLKIKIHKYKSLPILIFVFLVIPNLNFLIAYDTEQVVKESECKDDDVVCVINNSFSPIKKNIVDFSISNDGIKVKPQDANSNQKSNITAMAINVLPSSTSTVLKKDTSLGSSLSSISSDIAYGWNFFIQGVINNFIESGDVIKELVIRDNNINTESITTNNNTFTKQVTDTTQPPIKETQNIVKTQTIPSANKIVNVVTKVNQGVQGPQGPVGPRGPKGEAGNSIDVSNFISEVFFARQIDRIFDSISKSVRGLSDSLAKEVKTNSLIVSGDANINGDLTITGNLTGNVVGVVNPSFTLGSIPFQGNYGLAEDNVNLFWDATNSILKVGNILSTGTISGSNLSGVNTGDNAVNSLYSGLASSKQNTLNGTGFVKSTAGTISYDTNNYLTSYTETDPIYISSQAHNITNIDITHLSNLSGINTGDETTYSVKNKLGQASATTDGYLTSLDWNSFNNKVSSQWGNSGSNIYYSPGNVGVGTTTPSDKLEVNFSDAGYGGITINATAANGYAQLKLNRPSTARGSFINFSTAGTANWYTGTLYNGGSANSAYSISSDNTLASSKFVISTTGNIGIGTTTPGVKLHIQNSSASPQVLLKLDSDSATDGAGEIIHFVTSTDEGVGVQIGGYRDASGGTGSLRFSTYLDGRNPGLVEAMRITGAGNIGIGTINPTANLEVKNTSGAGNIFTLTNSSNNTAFTIDNAHLQSQFWIGSATFPGVTSGVDNDTGLFWPSPYNILGFSIAGSEKMRIDNNGNVGIGTTNPANGKLELATDSNTELFFSGSSSANIGSNTNIYMTAGTSKDLLLGAGGANGIVSILNSGNVGIGNTNPTALLHVGSSFPAIRYTQIDSSGQIIANFNNNGNSAPIQIRNLDVTPGISQAVTIQSYFARTGDISPREGGHISFGKEQEWTTNASTNDSFVSLRVMNNGSYNDALRISANGNVGIGTTTPGDKLQVNGNISLNTFISGSTLTRKIGLGTNNGSLVGHWGGVEFTESSGDNQEIHFWTSTGGGASTEKLTILGDGNIGIGTTTPGAPLEIRNNSTSGYVDSLKLSALGAISGHDFSMTNSYGRNLRIRQYNSNSTGPLSGSAFFQENGGSLLFVTNTANPIYFATNNRWATADMTIDASGNVGIGTISPTEKLDIESTSSTGTSLRLYNNYSAYGDRGIIKFNGNTAGGGNANTAMASIVGGHTDVGTMNYLDFKVGAWNNNNTIGSTVMRITSGGNIGIGTNNPTTAKLVVSSNLDTEINSTSNGQYGLRTSGPVKANDYYLYNNYGGFRTAQGSYMFYSDITGRFATGSSTGLSGLYNVIQNTTGSGTVATTGTTTLTGTNTSFLSTFKVGDTITVTGETIRTISAITSDTSLTVGVAFSTTASGLSYTLVGGNRLTVMGNGNVGIGTTSPNYLTEIVSTSAGSNIGVLNLKNNGSSAGTSVGLRFTPTNQLTSRYAEIQGINNTGNNDIDLAFITGYGASITEKMRIMSTGNVGIGTANPAEALDVNGNIHSLAGSYLQFGTTGTHTLIKDDASNGRTAIQARNNTVDILTANGTTWGTLRASTISGNSTASTNLTLDSTSNATKGFVLINPTGGNVGIGTTNPTEQLHVVGFGRITQYLSVGTPGTGFILGASNGFYQGGGSSNRGNINFGAATAGNSVPVVLSSGDGATYTGGNIQLKTDGLERLTVASSGNVGIGTTNPSVLLELNSGITGTPTNLLVRHTGTGAGDQSAYIDVRAENTAKFRGYNASGIQMFNFGNDANIGSGNLASLGHGNSADMVFDTSGNVGIGTTTPTAPLVVQANMGSHIQKWNDRFGNLLYYLTDDNFLSANSNSAFNITSGISQNVSLSLDSTPGFENIILNGGNVGIGTTTPSYNLQVGNNTVSGIVARFENDIGTCDINPTTSSLVCSSDMNLKKNITNLDGSEFILNENIEMPNSTLEKVIALTPVMYNWNNENDNTFKHVGFIAQEAEKLFPDIVFTDPNTNLKSVSYTSLIPYTVKAIQEMNITVKDLSSLDVTVENSLGFLITQFFEGQATFVKELTTSLFRVNGDVCVDDVCITKEEFKQMLINAKGTANINTPTPVEEVAPTVTSTTSDTSVISPVEIVTPLIDDTSTVTPSPESLTPETTTGENL